MNTVLPPIARPPDLADRVSEAEWPAVRAKIVAGAAADAGKTGGWAASRAVFAEDDRRRHQAAFDAAELRRIQARFPAKKD